MERPRDVLAHIGRHRNARRVTAAVNVSEKAILYDERDPHIEVQLERWIKFDLILVRFRARCDKISDARNGTVSALLIQPMRAELKAVRVADLVHVRGNARYDVARHDLVDGAILYLREDIHDRVLGTFDVLDQDREFPERRDPPAHAFAALGLLKDEPREPAVIRA